MSVSIIIPVYNVEKYIARCLDSVISQTYQDLEIIVVNDATPDNSMAIVEEYAARDSRIRIVHNSRNLGLMMTRKSGYAVAKGDYLTFLDSDDYLPLNAIEGLVAKAEEAGADIVSGIVKCLHVNGSESCLANSLPYGNDAEGTYKALLKNAFPHNLAGKIYKADLLVGRNYQTFSQMTNGEDACLFYQVVENAKCIMTIDAPVYYYMENGASVTHRKFSFKQIDNIILSNTVRNGIKDRHPRLQKLFSNHIGISLLNLYLHGLPQKEVSEHIRNAGLGEYLQPKMIFHSLCALPLLDLLRFLKAYLLR